MVKTELNSSYSILFKNKLAQEERLLTGIYIWLLRLRNDGSWLETAMFYVLIQRTTLNWFSWVILRKKNPFLNQKHLENEEKINWFCLHGLELNALCEILYCHSYMHNCNSSERRINKILKLSTNVKVLNVKEFR